jgi:hypothetical protein
MLTTVLALALCADPTTLEAPSLVPASPAITESAPTDRSEFIETSLRDATSSAQAWYWSWTGIHAGLLVAQASVGIWATTANQVSVRNSQFVGAAEDAIALAVHLAMPFSPAFSSSRLTGSGLAGDARLKRGEELLMKDAESAEGGRAWLPHVGGVVLGLAAGMVLWLGFHQLTDGLVSLAATVAINEIKIWTQPMRSRDNHLEYMKRYGMGGAPSTKGFSWYLAPQPGGAVFGATF